MGSSRLWTFQTPRSRFPGGLFWKGCKRCCWFDEGASLREDPKGGRMAGLVFIYFFLFLFLQGQYHSIPLGNFKSSNRYKEESRNIPQSNYVETPLPSLWASALLASLITYISRQFYVSGIRLYLLFFQLTISSNSLILQTEPHCWAELQQWYIGV